MSNVTNPNVSGLPRCHVVICEFVAGPGGFGGHCETASLFLDEDVILDEAARLARMLRPGMTMSVWSGDPCVYWTLRVPARRATGRSRTKRERNSGLVPVSRGAK